LLGDPATNHQKKRNTTYGLSLLAAGVALFSAQTPAQAADKKPNIPFIWGDDIGVHNISA
jgi:hypothetical protein